MAVSKAQQKAVNKYIRQNYDAYQVRMPKGQKAEIKAHTEHMGESVNGFINRAIVETMERDKAVSAALCEPQEAETTENSEIEQAETR